MQAKQSSKNKGPEPATPAPGWVIWTRLLLTVAVAGAGYLAWVSIQNGPVAGCGPESGCSKVLQSRWAYWLGVPVSVPAVLVYLGLLASTFFQQRRPGSEDQRRAWTLLVTLSFVVAGAALWFIGLQVFVLHSFCKFCMTAHTCGLVAAGLCLTRAPFGTEAPRSRWETAETKFLLNRRLALRLAGLGWAGVAVLVAGQLLVEKQRNVVKTIDLVSAPGKTNFTLLAPTSNVATATSQVRVAPAVPPNAVVPAPITPRAITTPPPALVVQPTSPPPAIAQRLQPRLLSLYNGSFQFKLDEVPMLGSPDAPMLSVCLFDYTCHHCRALHRMLAQAQQRFGNLLGIVTLPMPLATNCNPAIHRFMRPHAQACDYAYLGLAVWRANPAVFHQFDEWLFAPAEVAPIEQARQYAAQLVGAEKLRAAQADPWVTQQILTDGRLYETNYLKMSNSQMPQFILGPVISFGPLNSVQDVYRLLEQHLGLKAGP